MPNLDDQPDLTTATRLDRLRQRLAAADALLPLAVIGIASGLATGVVIVVFRILSEGALPALGLMSDPDHFEQLPWQLRLALPIVGGLVIGFIFQWVYIGSREVGIVHVMHRLAYHGSRLPWKNAVLQFFGAALAIICGHSVGREGPVVHVGAASSSLLGQWCGLPNNSLRILVACGTAASIGASFNTPVAGVIFAMEVVMMEYTLIGFAPVILASVVATSVSRAYFGDDTAFAAPALHLTSLWELPFILLVGVTLGALAAAFNQSIFALDRRTKPIRLWLRMGLAGAVVGVSALWVPEVMGIGYDSLASMLSGSVGFTMLALLLTFKFIATVACISMGVPGGLIGPTLIIGAAAGGLLGIAGHELFPAISSQAPFYILLGMGAMMGATLQAPLAALMAILELTSNPTIVLPGMLAIVAATLTARVVFRQESVFISLLRARGIEYHNDPVSVSLERVGVTAMMNRQLGTIDRHAALAEVNTVLAGNPQWILVAQGQLIVGVLPVDQLVKFAIEEAGSEREVPDWLFGEEPAADVLPSIRLQATLREALQSMDASNKDLVLITRTPFAAKNAVHGLLTREQIEASVRYKV
jgi:H+/Cl- antiporter ClcA